MMQIYNQMINKRVGIKVFSMYICTDFLFDCNFSHQMFSRTDSRVLRDHILNTYIIHLPFYTFFKTTFGYSYLHIRQIILEKITSQHFYTLLPPTVSVVGPSHQELSLTSRCG